MRDVRKLADERERMFREPELGSGRVGELPEPKGALLESGRRNEKRKSKKIKLARDTLIIARGKRRG